MQRENRANAWRRNARHISRRHEAAETKRARARTKPIDMSRSVGRATFNEKERRSLHIDPGTVKYQDTIKCLGTNIALLNHCACRTEFQAHFCRVSGCGNTSLARNKHIDGTVKYLDIIKSLGSNIALLNHCACRIEPRAVFC